jgi:hypothetical protein
MIKLGLVAALCACASSAGPRPAPPPDPARRSGDVEIKAYSAPTGCAFDLGEAPSIVADAGTLAKLLIPHTPACDPTAAASAFDFTRWRLFVGVVPQAGFNPNTRETIRPVNIAREGDAVVVEIDVPPNCEGAEREPGYVAIELPAGNAPVTVRNVSQVQCNYGGGDPPA